MTSFEALIKEAFNQSPKEIDAFFEEHFLTPLMNLLDTSETPAESIRLQRTQTKKIKNIFLAFAKK